MAKKGKESAKSPLEDGSVKKAAGKAVAGAVDETGGKSASGSRGKGGGSSKKSASLPADGPVKSAGAGKASQRGRASGKKASYVVGIGASAGGVEAFGELMEFLRPSSDMAFILVQHLDPTHESMLTEILQRRTKMPVEEATQGMTVMPGRVYVIPPNRQMTIRKGTLKLVPREASVKFTPIDHFFTSLAGELKHLAIGIVLSGTGSDGTQGLRAIKAEGGVTFAQDETARYAEMPKNAAHAGVVDFMLSPRLIAQELARIGRHPLIIPEEVEEIPETGHKEVQVAEVEEIGSIFRLLRQSSGIDFSNYKPNTIRRRISRRMVVAKVEKISEYLELLKKNQAEQQALANDLLINVTNFFRDPEIFTLLRERVLPDLLKQKLPGVPVRVWIAGCSTGEEAYSLAMCLSEAAGESNGRVPIQIFATDISEWAVERARSGIYPDSIMADVSKDRLRRFFTRVEGGYQVSKSIRDLCVFARQDLAKDPPFSRIDMISCRNVLIYLSPMLQKKIIPTFHYALNPSGVLVLGSSETIGGFADLFTLLDKKHKVYQKKQAVYRLNHDFEVAGYEDKPGLPKKAPVLETVPVFDVQREADRIILASYAPASVLINDEMDILQFRGKTSNYIEPVSGTASLNLMKMLREGLLLEVRALVIQSRKENLPTQKSGVVIQVDGKEKWVDLDVVPVRGPDTKKPHFFLVLFNEAVPPPPPEELQRKSPRNPELRQLEQLRQDLQATREYLQSTLEEKESMSEEFRAAVEEIQSSNEELQSTNEELETAKEELQSTNEELITVNEELQNRNSELSQVNNDLVNLLNNVSFPVVMLTTDLRIRRFTPLAEKILNLIPSDVGRPLSDLRLSILFPELEAMINDVVDTLAPQEQEVQDKDGRWYILRVRPYMTLDKKIDGVVMALLDINEMKQHMVQLHQAQAFADAVIKAVPAPLLVLGPDLKVEVANSAYYHLFNTSAAETEGKYLYTLGEGWNVPELRRRIEKIAFPGGSEEESITEQDGLTVGGKSLVLTGKRVQCAEGERILLSIVAKEPD
ncbi:MAG TPA: CheR family methyltransferase [Geomonas sp.]|nr:CheR family methyltransferase [Geomonas sp.]